MSGTRSKRRWAWEAAGLLAVALLAQPATAQTDRPLRAHVGYGADHPLTQSGWRAFSDALKAQKAAPKLGLFLNGPPPEDPAAIENLGRGDYGFGAAALPAFPQLFPYAALISELGLAGGEDELAAAAAATELLAIDCARCREAFQRQRIVFLGAYSAASYVLLSRARANAPLAFRGLTAITPGGAWDRLIASLGGRAHEDYGDAGDLFAKGEIGAAVTTPMELSDSDVWAHARHALIAPLGAYRGGGAFLASGIAWRKLSDDGRRAVMNAAADGMVGVVWGYQNMADAALRAAAARGLVIDAANPELADAMRRAIDADLARIGETARERFRIDDAGAFIERFLFLYDKFAVLLAQSRDAASAAQVLRQEIFDRLSAQRYGVEQGG